MFNVLERLQELREARGLSVYRLAKLSGIPLSTIATWYQKNLYPPLDKLEIICDTFGISLSEFFRTGTSRPLDQGQEMLLDRWDRLSQKEREAVLCIMDAFLS